MHRVVNGLQRGLALGLIALSCPITAAAAQDPPAVTERAIEPDTLRPGQYRWYEQSTPAEGPLSILVSLPVQRAYVFRGRAMIGVSTVSSGQPGYDTPTGAFTILEKDVDHRSNLYEDAPMPFMQRLTWDGVALHAGQVAAEPASHGCVRLPRTFARRLYGVTGLGTRVVITDQVPASPDEALALATGGSAGSAGTSIASAE